MAANEIVFKVKVEKDGNLSVVAKQAEKAAQGTDKLGKSTEDLTKKRSKYNKVEKGVGQAGLSGAKSFSKMRQTIGGGSSGLVGAYAVLAANVFALTAAFGALQRAAQVKQLEAGLTSLGTASGVALKSVSENLRQATGNALALEDAMRATALASSAGFSSDSIQRLGDVARKASIALGRDTADSLNRLTKGAIKLEPELLDELGIMVRLDTATTNYARSINKSAGDLTTFEKRQAFMNAVLEEGERKFSAMGDVETNPYDQLSATFNDLTKNLLNFLNNGLLPIINFFAGSQVALFGAMTLFAKGIATQMIPGLANLGGKYVEARRAATAFSLQQLKGLKTLEGGGVKLGKLAKAFDPAIHGQKELDEMIKTATNSLHLNTIALEKQKDALEKSDPVLIKKEATTKKAEDALNVLTQYQKDYTASLVDETKASAVGAAASGNYGDAISFLGDAKAEMSAQTQAGNTNLATTEGFLNRAGGAAARTALTVRVLGTAFLNMIPFIGQVIFFFGVFVSVSKKIQEFFKSDEQKDYESILRGQADANKELVESMKEVEAFEAGRGKLINNVTESYTAQFNILSGLNKQMQQLNKTGKTGGSSMTSSSDAAKGGYKDMFTSMIEGGQITTDMLPELTKNLTKAEAKIVTTAVESKRWGTLQDKTAKIMLNKTIPAMLAYPAIMHNLTMSTKEANQSIDDFSNSLSFKTDVDAVLAALSNMSKAMKDFGEGSAQDWVKGFKENAGDNMSSLIDFDAITMQASDNLLGKGMYGPAMPGDMAKEEQKLIKERTDALKVIFRGEQDVQRLAKSKIASSKAHNKLLGRQLLISGNAKMIEENKMAIAGEEVVLLRSKQAMFEQSTLLNAADTDYKERVLAFTQQIAEAEERTLELGQTAVGVAKENLRIAEAEQIVGRAINDDVERRIALLKKEITARETLSTNELRASNRLDPTTRGKGATSAAQDFKREFQELDANGETLENKKVSALMIEANAKHAMVDMEMTMLKFRLQVLMAEIKEADKKNGRVTDTDPITDIIDNIDGEGGLRSMALALITKEREAAESVIAEAKAMGIEGVQEQLRTGAIGGGIGSTEEAASVLATGTGTVGTAESQGTDHTGVPEAVTVSFLDKVDQFKGGMKGLIETAGKLGPNGELASSVANGALTIADAWGTAGLAIKKGGDKMAVGSAIATAAATTVSQIGNMMAASSQAKIAGIDNEINAEKKRDGKSKESLAKIKALEKKKENEKRKAFENQKKMTMAEIILSTAGAIMKASPNVPMMIAMGLMGAVNLAIAAGTSYQGGSAGAGAAGIPSSVSVGKRTNTVDTGKSQGASGELSYLRGDKGTGGPENFRGAFYGKKHRAAGGDTGYIVGEQGPELFMPDRPGTIVPADDTAAMGGGSNVTFNISTVDATGVEDLLAEQQGNII